MWVGCGQEDEDFARINGEVRTKDKDTPPKVDNR